MRFLDGFGNFLMHVRPQSEYLSLAARTHGGLSVITNAQHPPKRKRVFLVTALGIRKVFSSCRDVISSARKVAGQVGKWLHLVEK